MLLARGEGPLSPATFRSGRRVLRAVRAASDEKSDPQAMRARSQGPDQPSEPGLWSSDLHRHRGPRPNATRRSATSFEGEVASTGHWRVSSATDPRGVSCASISGAPDRRSCRRRCRPSCDGSCPAIAIHVPVERRERLFGPPRNWISKLLAVARETNRATRGCRARCSNRTGSLPRRIACCWRLRRSCSTPSDSGSAALLRCEIPVRRRPSDPSAGDERRPPSGFVAPGSRTGGHRILHGSRRSRPRGLILRAASSTSVRIARTANMLRRAVATAGSGGCHQTGSTPVRVPCDPP